MTRADSGIERLDYSTYEVLLGGRGSTPGGRRHQRQELYLAPRLGAMYRLSDKTVLRAGYGRTFNPLPWSRPMRGSFPYDIFFNQTAEQFGCARHARSRASRPVPVPDLSSGRVQLPRDIFMRSPNPTDVDRATIQQMNVAVEHRLPRRHLARSGLRPHAHRRRLRRPQHQLRRAGRRQRRAASSSRVAGTTDDQRLGRAHQEPLQRRCRSRSTVRSGTACC